MNLQECFEQLPDIAKWLAKEIGLAATDLNMSAYLVGGPVRDLLLKIPNLDLDFVVEGSAIDLAHHLQKNHPGKIIASAEHERFQTARITLQDLKIDLSTARTETYEHPAALPVVEASSLSEDLFRRDFTINALAICVNADRYGELTDTYNGLQDLKKKTIRILHPKSFIDDPTRVVRAARFAARLGFKLDPDTHEKAQAALDKGIFNDLGGVRMKTEIKAILNMPEPARLKALDLLASFSGTLCYLDAHLKYDAQIKKNLKSAKLILDHQPLADDWIVYMGVLVAQLGSQRLENLLERLQLDRHVRDHILEGITLSGQLSNLKLKSKASEIYHTVHGKSEHSLVIAASLEQSGSFARQAIRAYMEKLKDIHSYLGGEDLLEMGLPEGPIIGRALSMLIERKLDGILKTRNDEIRFIKANFPVTTK